jgi:glutamate-1-semialdehyde 2,1-aminomutase
MGGAQRIYGVRPDLAAFGKAIGNGFAISALVGSAELMRRGGFRHDEERVFLLSTTHGAESHGLAALLAVIEVYEQEGIVERLHERGRRLAGTLQPVIERHGLGEHVVLLGRDSNLVFATLDASKERSQLFRTLFLQEMVQRGVLGPSFVVSAALSDDDIERTAVALDGALAVYRQAIEDGVDRYLVGRPVQPVFRPYA